MWILTLILVIVAILLLWGMLQANPPVERGTRYAFFMLLEIVVGIVTLFTISSNYGQVFWLILAATPYIVELFVELVFFLPMRSSHTKEIARQRQIEEEQRKQLERLGGWHAVYKKVLRSIPSRYSVRTLGSIIEVSMHAGSKTENDYEYFGKEGTTMVYRGSHEVPLYKSVRINVLPDGSINMIYNWKDQILPLDQWSKDESLIARYISWMISASDARERGIL